MIHEAGTYRRWRGQFRYRGSRRESAVAQISTFGKVPRTIGGDTRFPEFESQFDAGTKVLETNDFTVWGYCNMAYH